MADLKNDVFLFFRMLMAPVARILLKAGVTYKELAEIAKDAYVLAATEDYGVDGRPTNISRVSILTGMTRRSVKEVRDRLVDADSKPLIKMNLASRVMAAWHQDPEFLGDDGRPRVLPIQGEGTSLATLLGRYASDVPFTAMFKELKNGKALEETDDGAVRALTRYYMPALMDTETVLRSGSVLQDLGRTVNYNLFREDDQLSRFERRASNERIHRDSLPEFREFIEQEAQGFLERVDAWLTEHEAAEDEDEQNTIRLGLGAYWIQEEDAKDPNNRR